MIWDCILLDDELDLLEVRLRTLEDVVDRWVITEANQTHRGDPKPMHLAAALTGRFDRWAARIDVIPVTFPEQAGPWDREHAQRDVISMIPAAGAHPDDVILLGDLDEIPDIGPGWIPPDWPSMFALRPHIFAVDWLYARPAAGTIACRLYDLAATTPTKLRLRRALLPQCGTGWHFSWLGGPAAIERKARGNAHPEYTAPMLQANEEGMCYEQGYVPWEGCYQAPADVDESWPELIRKRECPESWFRPRG